LVWVFSGAPSQGFVISPSPGQFRNIVAVHYLPWFFVSARLKNGLPRLIYRKYRANKQTRVIVYTNPRGWRMGMDRYYTTYLALPQGRKSLMCNAGFNCLSGLFEVVQESIRRIEESFPPSPSAGKGKAFLFGRRSLLLCQGALPGETDRMTPTTLVPATDGHFRHGIVVGSTPVRVRR
jgi:hypothetical protein